MLECWNNGMTGLSFETFFHHSITPLLHRSIELVGVARLARATYAGYGVYSSARRLLRHHSRKWGGGWIRTKDDLLVILTYETRERARRDAWPTFPNWHAVLVLPQPG